MPRHYLLERSKTPRLSESSNGEILHAISVQPRVFEAWQKQITGIKLGGMWPKDDAMKVQELIAISNRLQDVLIENERDDRNGLNVAQLARLSTLLVLTQEALTKAQAKLEDENSYSKFIRDAKNDDGSKLTRRDVELAFAGNGITSGLSSTIRSNQSAIEADGIAKEIQVRLREDQNTKIEVIVADVIKKGDVGATYVAGASKSTTKVAPRKL